jgi:Peptidase family M41
VAQVQRFIAKRTLVAFHEAGHAMVALHFGRDVLNITMLNQDEHNANASTTMGALTGCVTARDLEEEIQICLAGKQSELIGFHDHHGGEAADAEAAKHWAVQLLLPKMRGVSEIENLTVPLEVLLHRLEGEVSALLRTPSVWSAVETVAGYVLNYNSIDRETLRQIARHCLEVPTQHDYDAFRRFS